MRRSCGRGGGTRLAGASGGRDRLKERNHRLHRRLDGGKGVEDDRVLGRRGSSINGAGKLVDAVVSAVESASETGDARREVVGGGKAHVMKVHGKREERANASMKLSILDPGGIGLARGSPLKATVQGVARGVFQNVDGGLQAFYRGRVLSYMGVKARLQDGKPMDLLGGGESGRRGVSTPLVRRTSSRATVRAVVAGPRVLVRTRRLKAEGKRGLGISMGKGGVGERRKEGAHHSRN